MAIENKWYRAKIIDMKFRDNPYPYIDYILVIQRRMVKIKVPRNFKEMSILNCLFKNLNITIKNENYGALLGKEIILKPTRVKTKEGNYVYVLQGNDVLFNIHRVGVCFAGKEEAYANKL